MATQTFYTEFLTLPVVENRLCRSSPTCSIGCLLWQFEGLYHTNHTFKLEEALHQYLHE